jgi:hypothetical protein
MHINLINYRFHRKLNELDVKYQKLFLLNKLYFNQICKSNSFKTKTY